MANVRNIAYHVLYRVLYEDAYSAIAINNAVREEKLSGVDISFLSALVYGVLERKLTLEFIIRQYSSIRIKKIEAKTLIVLYLGVYQLIYMAFYDSRNLLKRPVSVFLKLIASDILLAGVIILIVKPLAGPAESIIRAILSFIRL